jgi:hypothetical protein
VPGSALHGAEDPQHMHAQYWMTSHECLCRTRKCSTFTGLSMHVCVKTAATAMSFTT